MRRELGLCTILLSFYEQGKYSNYPYVNSYLLHWLVIIWQQVAEEDLWAEPDNETGNETINFSAQPMLALAATGQWLKYSQCRINSPSSWARADRIHIVSALWCDIVTQCNLADKEPGSLEHSWPRCQYCINSRGHGASLQYFINVMGAQMGEGA